MNTAKTASSTTTIADCTFATTVAPTAFTATMATTTAEPKAFTHAAE
jgi:hypothetical protein